MTSSYTSIQRIFMVCWTLPAVSRSGAWEVRTKILLPASWLPRSGGSSCDPVRPADSCIFEQVSCDLVGTTIPIHGFLQESYAPLEDDNGIVNWAGEDCIGKAALLTLLDLGRKLFHAAENLYRMSSITLSTAWSVSDLPPPSSPPWVPRSREYRQPRQPLLYMNSVIW